MGNTRQALSQQVYHRFNRYFAWVVFGGLALWLVWLVRVYAVDLLYYDQVTLAAPLATTSNPLEIFFFRYARHRQGLAYVFWGWGQQLFGVDARVPAWLSLTFVLLGTLPALWVAQRANRPYWTDAIIPIVFLSTKHHETLFGAANPSHGPFPLFLLMGFAASLFVRHPVLRAMLASVAYFLLIFSGFGFLIVPVMLGYVALATIGIYRSQAPDAMLISALLLATVVGGGLFLWDYQSQSALACFTGEIRPAAQLTFAFAMLAHVLGFVQVNPAFVHPVVVMAGGAFFIGLAYITLQSGLSLAHGTHNDAARRTAGMIFITAGFCLAFVLVTAYGRECQGIFAAFSSRYVPYLLPGFWAVYLALKNQLSARSLIIVFVGVALLQLRAQDHWYHAIRGFHQDKTAIVRCSGGDPQNIPACQDELGIAVYPSTEQLRDRLDVIYDGDH